MPIFPVGTIHTAPGGLVVAVANDTILIADDASGRRDQRAVSELMIAVASADLGHAHHAMELAAQHLPAAAALIPLGREIRALLLGPLTLVARSGVANLTLDTHGGLSRGVAEITIPAATNTVTIGPTGVQPVTPSQGDVLTIAAARVGRLHITLTPATSGAPEFETPTPAVSPGGPAAPQPPPPQPLPASQAAPQPPAPHPSQSPPLSPLPGPPSAPRARPSPQSPPLPASPSAPPAQPSPQSPSPSAQPVTPATVAGDVANDPSDTESGAAVVQVFGVRCPKDHHNHPDTIYCAHCGLRMGVNQTAVVGLGPRPSLGLLRLDDSTTINLDRDLVVGREPGLHGLVTSEAATPLTVADRDLNMSRAHFAIQLSEWNVLITDLGSSNGTLLQRSDSATWAPIAANTAVELSSGDRIRTGSREFIVDLHHTGA